MRWKLWPWISVRPTPLISVTNAHLLLVFTGDLCYAVDPSPKPNNALRQISHHTQFCSRNVHMCAHFCYKIVHCGIWDRCIAEFEQHVNWCKFSNKYTEMGHLRLFNVKTAWNLYIIKIWNILSKCQFLSLPHYNDVIMSPIVSQITSLAIVYSTVYSVADQRRHQSSAPQAFVTVIHRGPVNSPHKGPVTRKMFPFDDVIMTSIFSMFYRKTLHQHYV